MHYYLMNPYIRRVLSAVVLDALCLLGAAGLSWWLLGPPFSATIYWGAATGMLGLCFVALYYCDAYSPDVLGSGRETLHSVANAMALAFLAALLVYFVAPAPRGAVEALAHTAAFYFPLLLMVRTAFRIVSSNPRFGERVVVIGVSDLAVAIAEVVRGRRKLGTQLVGFVTDDQSYQGQRIAGFPVIGKAHEIEKIVRELRIGRIVAAAKSRQEYFPAEELLGARLRGQAVESGVSFYERITGRIYLRDLRPSYLIFSGGFHMSRLGFAVKRAIDVLGASLGLFLSAPVLAACALAIRLDSKGPIFFRQQRVGRGGRVFTVWKLRSMEDMAEESTGPVFANREDARMTPVGRFLRKARLDELPQLWNVLIGDMSLVGPRPERPEFVEQLCQRYPYFRLRSTLKPGITGWAQIRHGYVNEVEGFEEKLALDLYYMKWRSVAMDLLILWHTVKTVVLFRGV
jgi:exopolysaccharide biosynthesis polyprenyl glycosylphosphotransferase